MNTPLGTIRRGFTLVELLIVMAVMLVLAAVTLPSIKSLLSGQKISQATRVVQAHIDAAKGRAIASGSYVAVIFERQANQPQTVTRLSVGQVFPPYRGDVVGAYGTLDNLKGWNPATKKFDTTIPDVYNDQLTVNAINGQLVMTGTFGAGDFIQIGDRESIFLIEGVNPSTGAISFYNPPYYILNKGLSTEAHYATEEGRFMPPKGTKVEFRIFRKPTKSYAPSSVLPRGTCVDLSVSGIGTSGNQFNSTALDSVMVVFDERGTVAFVMANIAGSIQLLPAGGLIHFMIGRTEQVLPAALQSIKTDSDPASVNSNLNDTENVWVSINPYSGAVYSSATQSGFESGSLAERLSAARSFATGATTRSVD